ncbi:hypothetical protein GPL21_07135 [Bradyrhizobium pachyrhizi]|uniref:Uncharacterized protein n=1 Tax=Bradyrhizobium pachyrhizi TaxID=280333 RepID=A0A844SLE7_9BRAD|nr:hypothetical protein [Bradyrhizobium pachyrhizi]MVT64879.1 hypothetical protein [Bradyrhizobium pachyrhizi]
MLDDFDLDELCRNPEVSYYFRYRLHRRDFHEFRLQDRVRGHYAAKPLYGQLTSAGRVDQAAGYSGEVAALFIPIKARVVHDVSLIVVHIDPQRITLPTGRRNWPAILEAAKDGIREMLAESSPSKRRDNTRLN